MKLASKVGVSLLAILLLAAPTTACMLQAANLTAAERECCKQMAGQCGNARVPSSHSCCRPLASPDDSSFVVAQSQHTHADLVALGTHATPIALKILVPNPASHVAWLGGIHGPPHSPPGLTPILRI